MSDFYGSAPEGKRIEYHEAKAERMTEDEQDLAAEIRRLDALLVQTRKDAMNELAAQVERAQQAERERDEALLDVQAERETVAEWSRRVNAAERERDEAQLYNQNREARLEKYTEALKVIEQTPHDEDLEEENRCPACLAYQVLL